jgi:3-isopropylmalate/(R)-2-methylmalate dehydratase small subunit
MEDINPDFVNRIKPGDVMVATTNFGCGSSREHAPLAIKASGISCVIARSFARIFFRNAINIGLPLLECGGAVDNIEAGDLVEIDLSRGMITNLKNGKTFTANPYPDFMAGIISAGGLIEYTRKRLKAAR